ncbi:alkane 1-monooxygenase [uncultured Lentibacter sp.]|jgi:alkane 1-monooxygenase|uniref:alkane 1-monooxygenase n=1 Tax=uncultured Lentibacter sp. TaxID=1659309 RepID=UPI00261E91F9|nr:alkane 1-monooxygenase [uncultured Lentibacter sp.]
MIYFSLATLAHVFLLALAAIFGGGFIAFALLYITLFTAALDRFVPHVLPQLPEGAEFPTGARLSVLMGLIHFGLLGLAVATISQEAQTALGQLGLFFAFALFFGQVSHPNAHELIHRSARGPRRLGRAVYASLLMGHHASAHVLLHHVYVASRDDPSSAPKGTGFYRFFLMAWARGFFEGYRRESARLKQAAKPPYAHPYLTDALIGLGMIVSSALLAGLAGVITYIALALYAQIQIVLADYVQHYGLRRKRLNDGKLEPVSSAHSWNSPHWFSAALMFNAPRHSDHHMHPQRPYPLLQLTPSKMPMLPHSLPVMAVIALYPPLYRKVMARALARLQPG